MVSHHLLRRRSILPHLKGRAVVFPDNKELNQAVIRGRDDSFENSRGWLCQKTLLTREEELIVYYRKNGTGTGSLVLN